MRRGRIIQGYAGASPTDRDPAANRRPSEGSGDEENRQPAPQQKRSPAKEESARPPMVTGRGRAGRLLSQMASLRVSQPATSSSSPLQQQQQHAGTNLGGDAASTSSESNEPVANRSRRGSDASSSSVLSAQFTKPAENARTILPKVKSEGGRPVELSLNFMTFETKQGTKIEEYHVDFMPQIESIRLRYMILRTEQAKDIIGQTMHWTGTNLYLPMKLKDKVTIFEAKHPATEQMTRVKLTYIKTPPDSELMPFYNSLMHKVMNKLKYVIINRHHYSPLHRIAIDQHKLEVWPGWITSIQRLDGGIKLAVDASFRVLRLETVRDIMMEVRTRARGNLKEAFEMELVGTIIMTRYNNRPYRIDEIDLTKKPSDSFLQRSTNTMITYAEYMERPDQGFESANNSA